MTAPRKEAKAGVFGLAGAGLALLVLAAAQTAVESFDPRREVSILVTAGLGLATFAVEMLRSSGRGALHPLVLVPAAAAAAALVAVAVIGVTVGLSEPGLSEQLEKAQADGQRGQRRSIGRERADFRGSGEKSYVLEFGDDPRTPREDARSDEIQVWDVRDDKLSMAFRFEPRLLGSERALFFFRGVGDIDGDGVEEFVGGYGTEAIRGELLVPFVIDWDADAGRYRLISLAREPAELATTGRGADVAGLRATYRKRLRLVNRHHEWPSLRVVGFPAQNFAVSPSNQALISGYTIDIQPRRSERLVEVQPQLFDRTGGPPTVRECTLGGRQPLSLRGLARGNLWRDLQRFWREASRDRDCAPA
jgi:hypothetical protein